jgi:hypothetical protein
MPTSIQFSHTLDYASVDGAIGIPVTLFAGGKTVDVVARLDTGSEYCIFARRYCAMLGLDLESGRRLRFVTATAPFFAYEHFVDISTFGIDFHAAVYFAEHPEFEKNVLGRRGWLDRLKIGIVDHDQMLYLGRYDS